MRTTVVVVVAMLMGCGGGRRFLEDGGVVRQCEPLGQPLGGQTLALEGLETTIDLFGPSFFCSGIAPVEVDVVTPEGAVSKALSVDVGERQRGNARFDVDSVLGATVRFTPSMPGRWALVARWSTGGETRQEIDVAAALRANPAIRRRFVDRMDLCMRGPFRTASALTLCQRDGNEVWVYGTDGQVLTHFPGEQLVVVGDEVWSSAAAHLEHRTARVDAVVLDGAVAIENAIEGPTTSGKAVRGSAGRLAEITWNGATLEARTLADDYGFTHSFIVPQGAEFWSPLGCLFERGCSQVQCPPVVTCNLGLDFIGLTSQAAWGQSASGSVMGVVLSLSALERPFSRSVPPRTVQFGLDSKTFGGSFSRALMVELPHVLIGKATLIPRLTATGDVTFVGLEVQGSPLSMTPEWIISAEDPFTLLAMPTPALD